MPCKEFSPVFHCVKGPDNIEADALSRLPFDNKLTLRSLEKKGVRFADSTIKNTNQFAGNSIETNDTIDKKTNVPKTASNPFDLFVNRPVDLPNFPVAFPQLKQAQQQDDSIQNTAHCLDKVFHDCTLKVCKRNQSVLFVEEEKSVT